MTDRPILFSAPMVRALLDGRKTQTRRILKDQPGDLDKPFMMDDGSWHVTDSRGGHMSPIAVRFRKGDRLWVRETWCAADRMYQTHDLDVPRVVGYPADRMGINYAGGRPNVVPEWDVRQWNWQKLEGKPGIHMPRWASRLTLTLTDVRVQRLQEISEADCIAEGIETVADNFGNGAAYRDYGLPDRADSAEWYRRPIDSFRSLWVKINGGASWVDSPWVVALTFTVERRNIDA